MSPDAQVENCISRILDDFNLDPENFDENLPPAKNVTNSTTNVTTTIRDPWKPCESQVGSIQVNSSHISIADRDTLVANIKDRFKCLYYSYRNRVLGEDPAAMKELEVGDDRCGSRCVYELTSEQCNLVKLFLGSSGCCLKWENDFLDMPLFETVNEDKIQGGRGPLIGEPLSASFFFDYKHPAKLPSRVERFKKGWLFDYDIYLAFDSTPENLVIAVFDEFSGCAVSTKFF